MTRMIVFFLGGLALSLGVRSALAQTAPIPATAAAPAAAKALSDAEIRDILVERIDTQKQSVGIVVGVIRPEGRQVVAYGLLDKGDARPLNGDTVYEIGSVTKVFTSLLLMDMVQRGEVSLNDPVAKYLPATVKMPTRNGRVITLEDLATHTSGLPVIPANLKPKDTTNPYSDYSVAQMYEFLSSYELTRDIGSKYEYSNLGVGLLGHVLALRAGKSYEELVESRICGPLGMKDTAITLSPQMKARMAVGHNATMAAVPNWDIPTLAGAGALRSTTNDMLTFVGANMGLIKSPLAPAIASMLTVRHPTGAPGLEIALGWHIFTQGGREIVWHNGGTGGYRTFIGYERASGMGVVVLSNANTLAGVDDIGLHLLNPATPLAKPPAVRAEAVVDPKVFDGYVGRYDLAPNFILSITREGDQFFVQATGQPKFQIFADNDTSYFLKVANARITFVTDDKGRATSLVLHQNGRDVPGKRMEEGAAPPQ